MQTLEARFLIAGKPGKQMPPLVRFGGTGRRVCLKVGHQRAAQMVRERAELVLLTVESEKGFDGESLCCFGIAGSTEGLEYRPFLIASGQFQADPPVGKGMPDASHRRRIAEGGFAQAIADQAAAGRLADGMAGQGDGMSRIDAGIVRQLHPPDDIQPAVEGDFAEGRIVLFRGREEHHPLDPQSR
jgi:hypothetical protein